MRKTNRTPGRDARSLNARFAQTALIAGVLGLVPLAASSAASPAAGAGSVETAASTAVAELVPVQPASDATDASPGPEQAAPSAPQETAIGRGSASFYAARFDGRRTASGERFDNRAMTAAHRSLPFGTLVRITNCATGASVVVRINDRGPFTRSRMIDVSRAAAEELGMIARGHATVDVAVIAS